MPTSNTNRPAAEPGRLTTVNAFHEDPIVSLDDIATIRRHLFRRWISNIAALALRLLVVWTVGMVAIYFVYAYVRPEWTPQRRLWVVALVMSAMVLVPLLIRVWGAMWLDLRIARRLDSMAKRTREGEPVRASEVEM